MHNISNDLALGSEDEHIRLIYTHCMGKINNKRLNGISTQFNKAICKSYISNITTESTFAYSHQV